MVLVSRGLLVRNGLGLGSGCLGFRLLGANWCRVHSVLLQMALSLRQVKPPKLFKPGPYLSEKMGLGFWV